MQKLGQAAESQPGSGFTCVSGTVEESSVRARGPFLPLGTQTVGSGHLGAALSLVSQAVCT